MKASKIGLLILILGFGGDGRDGVAGPQSLRRRPLGLAGPPGGKFSGPSFSFEDTESQVVPEGTPVEVENAFGGVRAVQGAPGEVKVVLRKVVFRRNEEEAGTFAGRIRLAAQARGRRARASAPTGARSRPARTGTAVGFETHLEVTLPPGTRLKVQNEHGAIDVSDVAEARVSGSYEAIRVERVGGRGRSRRAPRRRDGGRREGRARPSTRATAGSRSGR